VDTEFDVPSLTIV